MLSTSSRQRAERSIQQALSAGQSPWGALDAYRHCGGRIRWDDWFRLWRRIARDTAFVPGAARCRGGLWP